MRRWTTTALAAACMAAFVFALVHAAMHGGPTASGSNTATAITEEEALGMQDVPWGKSDFELFNNCQPLKVWAIVNISDLGGFSSAEARRLVELAAESRLRAARLYKNIHTGVAYTVDHTYLAITVGQVDRYSPPGFQVTLDFSKLLYDPASGTKQPVTTWFRSRFRRARDSGTSVAAAVSSLLDEFIAEYLRENDSACNAKWASEPL